MLRYLILLAAGGVYSDADTRALMSLSHWADDVEVLPISQHNTGAVDTVEEGENDPSVEHVYPIRMIVSIEGDFHIWRDVAAM